MLTRALMPSVPEEGSPGSAFADPLRSSQSFASKKPKERGPWDGQGEGPLSDRLLEDFSDGPLPQMRTPQPAQEQRGPSVLQAMRTDGCAGRPLSERTAMTALADTLVTLIVAAVWCGLTLKLAGKMLGGKVEPK